MLSDIEGTWIKGAVSGRLVDAGWGSSIGYPALVLDDGEQTVNGYVLASERLKDHWARLDDFEGHEYERVATDVRLADGSTVEAFVYVLRDGNPS